MLYSLTLPDETRECLLDLTWLQLDLLGYAANAMPLYKPKQTLAQRKKEIITTCAQYLDKQGTRYQGHSYKIAETFFQRYQIPNTQGGKSEKSEGGRFRFLEAFAEAYQKQPGNEKEQWLARLYQEVKDLAEEQPSHGQSSMLSIQNFYDEDIPGTKLKTQTAGKIQAGKFLLTFYDNYLGDSNSKIPDVFLIKTRTNGFGRRQLLELFHDQNRMLEMCAVCDETRFYTRYESQEKKGKIQRTSHAVIDHFLPKFTYPHLCCHPYNLVPICYSCNSPVKSTHDPLIDPATGQRRSLHRDALPYGKFNISEYAYLKISHESSPNLISAHEILARKSYTQPYIQESINILQDTFKLSKRWFDGDIPAERVMDALFRRMRHFLGNGKGNPLGTNIEEEIDNMLRLLLYYIDHEDKQKDPLTFAMSWLLASFLKEHEKNSPAWRGLVDEITTWFGQDLEKSKERNDYVQSLLNILNEPSQKKINQNAALQ